MSALAGAVAGAVVGSLLVGVMVQIISSLVTRAMKDPGLIHAVRALALGTLLLSFVAILLHGLLVPREFVAGPGPSSIVFAAWLVGVAGMSVRLGVGLRATAVLRRRAKELGGRWPDVCRRYAVRLGLGSTPVVAVSRDVGVPCVVGWWRPVIIFPAAMLMRCPMRALEVALVHELAHVARRDVAIALLVAVAEAILFFHPVAWWLGRDLARWREHAADDLAVEIMEIMGVMGDRTGYARALVELEAARQPAGVPALAMAAIGDPTLRERVEHLVGRGRKRGAGGALATLLALFAYVAIVAPAPQPPVTAARVGAMPGTAPERATEVGRWQPLFAALGDKHGVDPDLLAAVTWAESRGNASAVSPVGARGLMQLMPRTADRLAAARGEVPLDPVRLFDPVYNVDLGAEYLAKQLEEFSGERALAVAAYNAGPTRVRKWLRGEADLPEETQRYRDAVLTRYAANRPTERR